MECIDGLDADKGIMGRGALEMSGVGLRVAGSRPDSVSKVEDGFECNTALPHSQGDVIKLEERPQAQLVQR